MRSSRRSLPQLLAATVAACALVPAAAHAATIGMENGSLTYRGQGSEGITAMTISTTTMNGPTELLFGTTGADSVTYDHAICRESEYMVSAVLCDYDPSVPVQMIGSEGVDNMFVSGSDLPSSLSLTMDGAGGDDTLKDSALVDAARTLSGGAGNDKIEGYGGNDTLDGGDGNDEVNGNAGNDVVRGGNGDDVVNGDNFKSPGADVIDGGPGNDQIEDWSIPSGDVHPQPTVTLDGAADDGRPGEGDNVTGVEKFTFYVNATFTGTDAPEVVEVANVSEGASTLQGLGGADTLKGADSPDTIDGGTGDDQLNGGNGNDTITGGAGKDTIMGDATAGGCTVVGYFGSCKSPWGNDVVNAVDGEVDSVDCGPGQDTANVDAIDVVTNCEVVTKGAGVAPGADPNAGNTGKTAKGLALIGAAKIKALLAGKLAVGVPCAAACRVTVTARSGGRTVATGRATLLEAGTAKVNLRVAKKAKRPLKRAKQVKLSLTATVAGASGKPVKLTKALTLRK
ncbi:MAG TPA: calcium-binding protein [Baekduia sp.]|nr:calcium-binding protein [Baekduia sp.]